MLSGFYFGGGEVGWGGVGTGRLVGRFPEFG